MAGYVNARPHLQLCQLGRQCHFGTKTFSHHYTRSGIKLRDLKGYRLELRTGRKFSVRSVVLLARPGPFALRLRPARHGQARRFTARPVPAQKISGTFPTMFAHRVLLVYFFTVISVFSGNFYCIIYVFIVLSMFRETFRKFSSLDRGKGNTRHRLRHTTRPTGNEPGRAGPGLNFGSSARARPVRKIGIFRPGPRAARPVLSSIIDARYLH
jgi:hypothetical protein